MKQGIAFIRRQGTMEALIGLAFSMTVLGIPLIVFLPVFARDVFHQGPSTYTLLLSISGAGSVVGALVVAAMGNIRRKGRAALLMLAGLGASMAGFSLSESLPLSCVLLFLSGAALVSVFSLITSLVQLITSDEMRGRVMSVYNIAFRGGMPIGSLATGWLVPRFSAPTVLACSGLLLALLGVYFLVGYRKVARL
jgi:predicted MFS family arabinose efflux permease